MSEKEFISQFKNLKRIRPQSSWLKSNREILLSQINNSGTENLSLVRRLLIDLRSFSLVVSKPVALIASLALFLVATAAYSHLAFKQARPNDSLYIARVISERVKLTTVFSPEEKKKLEARFAASHVEAIAEILAKEASLKEEINEDKLARLNDSFNKEINIVREKIAVINNRQASDNSIDEVVSSEGESQDLSKDEEYSVIVADANKDEQGTQLSIADDNNKTEDTLSSENEVETASEPENDSLKDRQAAESELATILDELQDPQLVLEEVQALFDAQDYQGALEKIRKFKKMIN